MNYIVSELVLSCLPIHYKALPLIGPVHACETRMHLPIFAVHPHVQLVYEGSRPYPHVIFCDSNNAIITNHLGFFFFYKLFIGVLGDGNYSCNHTVVF